MAFDNWSVNPANNTLVDGINWSENQLPSTVNGSARQMMADLATWRDSLYLGSRFALTSGQIFNGAIGRDAQYYMDFSGGNPVVNFDVNDSLIYDRTGNQFIFRIGNNDRLFLRSSDAILNGNFQAQTPGSRVTAGGQGSGTSSLEAAANSANTGIVAFRRADGTRSGYIGNMITSAGQQSLSYINETGGPHVFGTEAQSTSFRLSGLDAYFANSGTNTILSFDTGDYVQYDRANNQYAFYIGGQIQMLLQANGNLLVRGNVFGNWPF